MKVMNLNYTFLLFFIVIIFSHKSFAAIEPGVGCWTDSYILMPGVSETVYVDRANMLDPIMRGDYLLSTFSTRMKCASEEDAKSSSLHVNAYQVISTGVGGYGTDLAGNPAVQFNEGGLGIEMYLSTDAGTDTYFASAMPVSANFPASTDFTINLGLYLVSTTGGVITAGEHHFSGFYGDIMAGNDILIALGSFNINVILTSCRITTPSAVTMDWGSVSSAEIVSGEVETRTANIGIYCGEIQTPVSISFASSNGYVNASEGIIRTSVEENNLGLQLTWESNGLPIVMNEKISDVILGSKNFNVVGKPVPINPSQPIRAGDFTGNITMMFAYR